MIKEEEEDMDDNNHHHHHTNHPNNQNQKHVPDGSKESEELETLGILEQDLPIELSFLIRQQAYCMARMNYLDRQIRELKETTKQQNNSSTAATCSRFALNNMNNTNQSHLYHQQQQQPIYHNNNYPQHHHHPLNRANFYNSGNNLALNQIVSSNNTIPTNNILNTNATSHIISSNNNATTATTTNAKNGNFIPSDDSGGEYSRATISDDDELSSLLDQIAKSVKPVDNRSNNLGSITNQQLTPQQQIPIQLQTQPLQRPQYNIIHHNNLNQPYAILNPGQLHPHHHQAVPVFVMGSPITTTTAHHPSSISSTILPGVHFQPEPRYNQYYEDFYIQHQQPPSSATIINSNTSTMTNNMMRHSNSSNNICSNRIRSRQFDSSISAIEQLVSQKEKRQIKSQLRSADNWLKMRASGLCGNLNDLNNLTTSSSSGSINGVAPITSSTATVVGQQLGSNNNGQVVNNNINGCGDNIDRNLKTSTSASIGMQDNNNSNNSVIDHQHQVGKSSKSR